MDATTEADMTVLASDDQFIDAFSPCGDTSIIKVMVLIYFIWNYFTESKRLPWVSVFTG